MKRPQQVGLIVEGNSTRSSVLRLSNVAAEIGPIKSTALRVARRVGNFLRAGFAVSHYSGLQDTRMILIRAPDTAVARIVEDLESSGLELRGLTFVLCETWLPSSALAPLERHGASVATLVELSGSGRPWFLLEGRSHGVRQIRTLLESAGARGLELRHGAKPLYFAASLLTASIPFPVLSTAQRALRESGISGRNLNVVMQELSQRMLSDFLRGGRAHRKGPLTECSGALADSLLLALREHNPDIATIVDEQLAWSGKHLPKRRAAH